MERLECRFIWAGVQDKSTYHLVRWDVCKSTKERGGLGILDLGCMNSALLCKWFWKYALEPSSWWRNLIDVKYLRTSSEWRAGNGVGPIGCSIWRCIMKEENMFWKFASVSPGGGAWVSFWNDCWIPGKMLKDSYPRVAAASSNRDAWVSDLISFDNERVVWDFPLMYSLRGGADRERNDLLNLLSLLPHDLINAGPAKLIWNPSPKDGFSVNSMYRALIHDRMVGLDNFPFKVVWQPHVPSKVNAFLWLIMHRRILTHENLKRRGWSLASRCVLCEEAEESTNHLLCQCRYSSSIWCLLQQLFGFLGPFPDCFASIIHCWSPRSQLPWMSSLAACILHAFAWELWKERNNRSFHDKRCGWQVVFHKTCRTLLSWVRVTGTLSDSQSAEWLSLGHILCPLQIRSDSRMGATSSSPPDL
ncbi:unnamed protein product [Linum trigynum]|uniref:Reverse transcriptase zinc-binding domain-containing protein n=1 Tax=Linum trigynum TaxID=586398 RepID=A0AAV2DM71_9ROSI